MSYRIRMNWNGYYFLSDHKFATRGEAYQFIDGSQIAATVVCDIPPLNNWTPDEADTHVLELLAKKEFPVDGIYFIRIKSGAGLLEAKQYFDAHFRRQ